MRKLVTRLAALAVAGCLFATGLAQAATTPKHKAAVKPAVHHAMKMKAKKAVHMTKTVTLTGVVKKFNAKMLTFQESSPHKKRAMVKLASNVKYVPGKAHLKVGSHVKLRLNRFSYADEITVVK